MKIFILTLLFGLLGCTICKPLDTKEATDALVEHRSSDIDLNEDEHTLSYYGGLKGQFVHFKDGKLLDPSNNEQEHTHTSSRQGPVAAASQLAVTAQDRQKANGNKANFAEDFNKIQEAAARLVAIQELAKRKGSFSAEDNRVYAASLLELGRAAQNLAMLQQNGEIHDFSVLLQPLEAVEMPQKTPPNTDKNSENGIAVEALSKPQIVEAVTEEQNIHDPEILPPNAEDPYEDAHDSVVITPPKKDASVAEAKPISLSIAGEGGVASAKPNAVALSGRNGLAVSAPKATAIAGVTPEEAAAFSVSLPSRHNLILKTSASDLPSAFYDNYDDIETSPLQANTRNRNTLVQKFTTNAGHNKVRPMQATINAADAIVKMWRTALADEEGAAYDHKNDLNIEQYFKNFRKLQPTRRN